MQIEPTSSQQTSILTKPKNTVLGYYRQASSNRTCKQNNKKGTNLKMLSSFLLENPIEYNILSTAKKIAPITIIALDSIPIKSKSPMIKLNNAITIIEILLEWPLR